MILDGAVDPNADPIEADIRQAAAFQTAFNDYAADCATDAQTARWAPIPPRRSTSTSSLVEPLVEKPAKTQDPRGLSYSDAIVGTILPLYSPNLWRHLTQALTELKDGKGDTMLALADLYMGRDEEGHYNNSTDVRVAVNCVDKPRGHRPRQGRRRGPAHPRGGAVHELRRVHRARAAGHLRVLAGADDDRAARDQGRRAAADPGGVDDQRPRHAVPGGRRPGPASSAARCSPSRAPSTPSSSRETRASTTSRRATLST